MKTDDLFRRTHWHTTFVLMLIAALVVTTGVLAAAAGALDPTFDSDGKVVTNIRGVDEIHAIVIQPDGKIVAAGTSDKDFSLARYNPNGSLDSTFDSDGKVLTDINGVDNIANAIALQNNGKIVVAGYNSIGSEHDFALARYNSNGSLDSTFDGDGIVVTDRDQAELCNAVAILSDGDIIAAGVTDRWFENDFMLIRYSSNGSLGFIRITSIKLHDFANAIAIQPDGKIIVAGDSFNAGGTLDFSLVRYNSNLSLDTTFDYDGKVVTDIRGQDNYGYALALQPDGKIVMAGTTGLNDFALVRYNSNGSLDSTFDGDGIVVTDFGGIDVAKAVAIQADGKIVAAGLSNRLGTYDLALTRYNTNGSLDTTFDEDGKVLTNIGTTDYGYAVALQSNGKIVAAGESDENYALARYLAISSGIEQTFYSNGAQDGWVLESSENSTVGGSLNSTDTGFNLGDNAQNKQFRAILSFNTAGLPDTAVITKVTLKILLQAAYGANPFTALNGLRVDIRKPFFGSTVNLEIGDFQAAAEKPSVATFDDTPFQYWYSATIGSAGYPYINLAGTTQFRLRFATDDNNNHIADYMRFFSGNDSWENVKPRLIIRYDVP